MRTLSNQTLPDKTSKSGLYPIIDTKNTTACSNTFNNLTFVNQDNIAISSETIELVIPPSEEPPPPEISNKSANRICIGVIDETSSTSFAAYNNNYATFRNLWPERELWVMRVGLSSPFYIPSNWGSNPNDKAITQVNRDNGNDSSRSDWFNIAQLSRLQGVSNARIGLFIDNSGSMTTGSVLASYNYFLQQIQDINASIITVENSNEDYITPFITMNE